MKRPNGGGVGWRRLVAVQRCSGGNCQAVADTKHTHRLDWAGTCTCTGRQGIDRGGAPAMREQFYVLLRTGTE